MFTKIDIKEFGLYKDFNWHPTMMREFNKVNIIYGRNYSGKTTLSRVFDSVGQGKLHKNYTEGEFKLYTDQTTTPEVTNDNLSYDGLVRVYNSDYVSRNLGWLKDEDAGEIRSFTLLGEDNIKAKEAIDAIDAQLGSVDKGTGLLYACALKEEEFNSKKQAHDAIKSTLDEQLRNKANNDIKRNKYFVKLGDTYNVSSLQKDINEFVTIETITVDERGAKLEKPRLKLVVDGAVVLEEEKKKELERTVDENEKDRLDRLPETKHHLMECVMRVCELVSKRITLTKTLHELIADDLLQKWVDEGRNLNKERTTCAFCGGPLTKERWDALDAHFSKESEDLKIELLEQRKTLEAANMSLENFLASRGITQDCFYASLQSEFEAVILDWKGCVNENKTVISSFIALIDERLSNLFKPVDVAIWVDTDNPNSASEYAGQVLEKLELIPILKRINALIDLNNSYGARLDEAKKEARKKLRLNYVHGFCKDIKYADIVERWENEKDKVSGLEEDVKRLYEKITELRTQRKQKELERKDEGKAARKVSELLVKHFGNGSLSLEPEQVNEVDEETGELNPRTRFVVKRGLDYAKNLSEGERSLIAFCYFIAQMDDELKGADAARLVIFIDDPISSLDSSHIFFMYSLIDGVIAAPKKYGQLFISTHNLEFLKFLKRLKLPGDIHDKKIEHFVVEKLRKGDDDYRCSIRMMPDYLKNYVTEYNFLFQQVYDIAKPISGDKGEKYRNTYSLYYNVANNMRKFLECYLFYRFPDSDDPTKDHLNMLFEGHELAKVFRVVNEYSHLAWAERGLKVIDVPEIETTAKLIMKAIKTKDPEHFSVLCKSVKVDETVDFS